MKRSVENNKSCVGDACNQRPLKLMKTEDDLKAKFDGLDDLFNSLDLSYLDKIYSNRDRVLPESSVDEISEIKRDLMNITPPSSLRYPKLDNRLICMQELGRSLFLRAEVYGKGIEIHIRQYVNDGNNILHPMETGVCINLKTWYRFCQKLFDFNLLYTSSSFIANNKLIVLNLNGEMFVQTMDYFQSVMLREDQLAVLKEHVNDFNEKLLSFTYEVYLPALIADNRPPNTNCFEDSDILEARLIACLEKVLASTVLKDEYICQGCLLSENSQRYHGCLNIRNLHKFDCVGKMSLLTVNFMHVVDVFLQNTPNISVMFLQNFNLKMIIDVLFKLPEDVL